MSESVFRGWPSTALEFYDGLEADNSKAYWLEYKDVYDRVVKPPMEALLAEHPSMADENTQMKARIEALEQRVHELEHRVARLEGQQAALHELEGK